VIRGRQLLLTSLAVLVSSGVLASCGGGTKRPAARTTSTATSPSPHSKTKTATGTNCFHVGAVLNRVILAHVVLANARMLDIRAARAKDAPAYYYVSGSLSGSGTQRLLATWVTASLDGKNPVYSVDANAALISLFGASSQVSLSLSIQAPAARRSRTCVAGSRAQPGLPAPAGGHGAPAGQ
jgi:hypothetical protein